MKNEIIIAPADQAEAARRGQQLAAHEELAAEVRRLFGAFEKQGRALGESLVEHVNTGRQIGLLLKEWQGREQVTFEFFHRHQEQLPFAFDTAQRFVSMANRMPGPAESVDDARRVLQLDFQAAGLLNLPERGPQIAHAPTGFVMFVGALGAAKERFLKWTDDEPVEQWPPASRETVRAKLRPFVELYERLGEE